MWSLLIAGAIVAAAGREFWYFSALPMRAHLARTRGDVDAARQILEMVIATPTIFSRRAKLVMRYRLAVLYMQAQRYEEAADNLRLLLDTTLKPSVESDVRRRLADCLEGSGQRQASDEERRRAEHCLEGQVQDGFWYLSQGLLHEKEQRFPEACDSYEQALALLPGNRSTARTEAMARLSLSSFNAGRPDQAVRWAEETIAQKPGIEIRILAHGFAGLGYGNLGRLEEAEEHKKIAMELAMLAGNQDRAAECMVSLADIMRKRGKIVEAMEACDHAAGMSLKARRIARTTQAECLRAWGRFDEAKEVLAQAQCAPTLFIPSMERRSQAVLSLGKAWLEAENDDPEKALEHLEEASIELANDSKLSLWCDATTAWVYASMGRHEEAVETMEHVEARSAEFAADRSTCLGSLSSLGRAAYLLGDFELSKTYWQQYLELHPDPVWQPKGLYYLGECHLHLGDIASALSSFERAVEMGFDTEHVTRSQRRLQEQALKLST